MIYNIYYLRATPAKFDKLITLAVRLGILALSEDKQVYAPDGAYDYLGPIAIIPPLTEEEIAAGGRIYKEGDVIPDPVYVKDAKGEILVHANLALPYSLNEVGMEIAQEDTETAEVFAAIQEYFVTSSETGKAAEPVAPARVFLDASKLPIAPIPEPSFGEPLVIPYAGEGE